VQNSSLSASSTTSRLSFHRYPLHQLLLLASPHSIDHSVSFTQLFPLFQPDGIRKAYLVPGILTVVFVVVMFTTAGKPEAAYFNQILVAILAGAAYYFVYQLCGKHKPWWVLLASALATVLILLSPSCLCLLMSFCVLPGRLPTGSESVSLPELVRMFLGLG